ncbi:MAG TPA: M20/M25/M40 family metallo-hydrolase [Terriglobia bacterium]|nr:M20/M25/M40 family metallo-hydrolase [Terriglobia bacterium]
MDFCELTKALVNIESVTGNERACADFVTRHLATRGFEVEQIPVADGDPVGRANVFATCGRPEVVLSTHLDTVPPFFPAREDGEFIYGRGSCDAKGIAASQVVAAERLRAEGVRDFGLLFLVGEETVSDGARAANAQPRGSKYIINGEPTENRLAVGSKGILRLDVHTRGRMAHSAYPQFGESAIEKLLDILAEVRRLPLPTDPVLGPSTANIGLISGGRAANVIPDEAAAQILFRTVNGATGLRRELERIVQGRCDYEFVRETPALHMEKLDGFETDVVAFTTDLPSLGSWGRPLLLGPGSIRVAHTENECVRKADLARAVDLYCRLVRELKAREAQAAVATEAQRHRA